MLGQTYRLIKATTAVVRNVARQVCRVLPEGAVVIVQNTNDSVKTVNIRCENQELWMFTADLGEGDAFCSRAKYRTGALILPMPLHRCTE
jgi:hypothetical protein